MPDQRPVNSAGKDETVFANARLVLQDRVLDGAVTISDGLITDIRKGGAVPPGAVDCQRDFIAPGMVELHTDNLERHLQPRPSVHMPHAAAILAHDAELAGVGITTVFDAMRVGSMNSGGRAAKTDYAKYARGLATELLAVRATGALRISHFLHLRAEVCSETLVEELDEFTAEDRVGLISLMDHTPGQRQYRDVSKLAQYVQGRFGLNDEEFEAHVGFLHGLRKTYGDANEVAAIEVARKFGAVLASHDDTTDDQVTASAAQGIRLAEFPTTVEAARACHAQGIQIIMGAPNLIRGGSHSGNVAAMELAKLDLLDIVSSDYVPSALLSSAIMLAGVWDDLPRAIASVTANPADAAGLADRGRLEVGKRADLIRFGMFENTPVLRETWVQGRRVA
ncbi:alpha-D-ribose 1-methylphosphonate 5-triphosphate diphosphatase [Paracoccus pacificus]|uniref:Alpha-D-ribose 1-methylphosphonate 5-triphosphate diphosphatase n=1 Tax=Paracoccus pacificus TaxID=1463598 RepID=A0ABW4R825_9RHOB